MVSVKFVYRFLRCRLAFFFFTDGFVIFLQDLQGHAHKFLYSMSLHFLRNYITYICNVLHEMFYANSNTKNQQTPRAR